MNKSVEFAMRTEVKSEAGHVVVIVDTRYTRDAGIETAFWMDSPHKGQTEIVRAHMDTDRAVEVHRATVSEFTALVEDIEDMIQSTAWRAFSKGVSSIKSKATATGFSFPF